MADFKADLNPKTNSMSLYDLVKMNEYMGSKAKTKPAAPVKPAPGNVKSNLDDDGVPFKFGNNYQADE
jgi:hypothetical protein